MLKIITYYFIEKNLLKNRPISNTKKSTNLILKKQIADIFLIQFHNKNISLHTLKIRLTKKCTLFYLTSLSDRH